MTCRSGYRVDLHYRIGSELVVLVRVFHSSLNFRRCSRVLQSRSCSIYWLRRMCYADDRYPILLSSTVPSQAGQLHLSCLFVYLFGLGWFRFVLVWLLMLFGFVTPLVKSCCCGYRQ